MMPFDTVSSMGFRLGCVFSVALAIAGCPGSEGPRNLREIVSLETATPAKTAVGSPVVARDFQPRRNDDDQPKEEREVPDPSTSTHVKKANPAPGPSWRVEHFHEQDGWKPAAANLSAKEWGKILAGKIVQEFNRRTRSHLGEAAGLELEGASRRNAEALVKDGARFVCTGTLEKLHRKRNTWTLDVMYRLRKNTKDRELPLVEGKRMQGTVTGSMGDTVFDRLLTDLAEDIVDELLTRVPQDLIASGD